jgi:hypothetical protein
MGGVQTKTLSHFAEIGKQLVWGNKLIMLKNKSLMFDNWINSDLIYINDHFFTGLQYFFIAIRNIS